MLKSVNKVDVLDPYTVKCTLKEPFAWFLDMIANPMAVAIIAGSASRSSATSRSPRRWWGRDPWMLDSYRPNAGYTLVRNPHYFIRGLPHIDRIEAVVDKENASRIASFLAAKYDLGWEFPGTINRTDWVPCPGSSLATSSFSCSRRRPTPATSTSCGPSLASIGRFTSSTSSGWAGSWAATSGNPSGPAAPSPRS